MKVPWKWLNEYVELDWTPEEACERLTLAGVKVEELTYEKVDLSGVVSALVEDVSPHPSRPDLRVGLLSTGTGRFTVVSGAPGLLKGNMVLWPYPVHVYRAEWLSRQKRGRSRVPRDGRLLQRNSRRGGTQAR